jgi:hypothetical protein
MHIKPSAGCQISTLIVLQQNAMLWDIPCSKNRNVIPEISVFIGHASRPPKRIKIQLNATKCWLNIIHRTLEKYSNTFYKNKQNINPACACHIYLIDSIILFYLFIFTIPKCLCVCTGSIVVWSKLNVKLHSAPLILKIIISVLLANMVLKGICFVG